MFERCLYFNINALTRAINRIWNDAFAEFDLSPAHAYLLRLVLTSPGLSSKQLSHELKLEKSTITRFVQALEDKGLVQRKKGVGSDAREQGIFATRKAQNMAQKLEQRGNDLYKRMATALGKEQLTTLVKQLREMESTFK